MRAIREPLYDPPKRRAKRAAELVNAMLAESGAVPQLVRHGEWDWHLHGVAGDAPRRPGWSSTRRWR